MSISIVSSKVVGRGNPLLHNYILGSDNGIDPCTIWGMLIYEDGAPDNNLLRLGFVVNAMKTVHEHMRDGTWGVDGEGAFADGRWPTGMIITEIEGQRLRMRPGTAYSNLTKGYTVAVNIADGADQFIPIGDYSVNGAAFKIGVGGGE